ncbi:hypothetical protein [Streptomyces sp. DSM 40484]|uniref:hypothetical protein n=1 Tax=Streptomyces kroppenstedtii TaxID=3051181 RepID=UPI0028D1A79A|nr:hypothetical protein [Streptomyces sp. DSM 40484]
MAATEDQVRVSSVMHVRCQDRLPDETFRQVLEQCAELSPTVQALPPSAALVELKGALRYHGADARRLGEVLRVRTLSRLGTDVRVGIGPTITVAATASGQIDGPGGVLAVDPDQVLDWLGPLPVEALHGIGPKQAAALREYGVHCVGLLATIPRPRCSACWAAGPAGSPSTGTADRPPPRRPARPARIGERAALPPAESVRTTGPWCGPTIHGSHIRKLPQMAASGSIVREIEEP